ncbi:MAG TPA: SAM-dependent methyltransferase, partial [Telluria sp.]
MEELDSIASATLADYNSNAAGFFAGTRDHDVSQNIDALLSAITAPMPYAILDFGCGPGRDLATFTRLGHQATGLDGS